MAHDTDDRDDIRTTEGDAGGSGRSGGWTAGLGAAAALAGLAWSVRQRARRANHDHPPGGHWLYVEGVRLHYLDRGEGPPVVLIHGNGSLVQDFEISILPSLVERHRVVAFDRPGFGHSSRPRDRMWTPLAQADLLAAALRRMGLQRPLVVGHSAGVTVALALALAHPELVGGMVLMGGYAYPTVRPDFWPLSLPGTPVLGDLLRHTVSPALSRLLLPKICERLFDPAPVPDGFIDGMPWELILRPSQLRAASQDLGFLNAATAEMSPAYRRIDVPVIVLQGDGDAVVPIDDHGVRLAEALPRGELRRLPGLGHMLHHSNPEAALGAIADISARMGAR
ncbi:MAG TPA: alpha/beta hydrolase [Alphaproteobacteria bacterium]|nr:alpha/beta hydrolase [Alphaproteobacteria bacterium]